MSFPELPVRHPMAFAASCLLCIACGPLHESGRADDVAVAPPPDHLKVPKADEKLQTLIDARDNLFEKMKLDALLADRIRLTQQLKEIIADINRWQIRRDPLPFNRPPLGEPYYTREECGIELTRLDAEKKKVQIDSSAVEDELNRFRKKWTDLYGEMRELLPRDRTDPQLVAICQTLQALENRNAVGSPQCDSSVLLAIAGLYNGRDIGEIKELLHRCKNNSEWNEFAPWLQIEVDWCYACCLAGMPELADDFIRQVKLLNRKNTTPEQDHAVGLHAISTQNKKDTRVLRAAKDFMQSGTDKLGKIKQPATPQLIADTALVLMMEQSKQNLVKVRRMLDACDGTQGCWQMLRARAMLSAAEGDCEQAATLMEACQERAPLALERGLREEWASYKQNKPFKR
jgi:hypothetical protein